MTPLEELRATGRPGHATAALVYATVRAVVRFRNFPPPGGHQGWSRPAFLEVAHDFLADDRTPKRWATLVATATDDNDLERRLNATVRNYLRDEARRTDRAHLLARIGDCLDAAPDRFVALPAARLGTPHWALHETAEVAPWQGRTSELIEAARGVTDLNRQEWANAQRRGPIIDCDSWQRLCHAVLSRAAAPVATATLADVAVHRLSLRPRPDEVPIDGIDVDPPAPPETPTAADPAIAAPAERIWEQLTDRDRLVLAHHDATVREIAGILGLGKSAAHQARTATLYKIGALVTDDGEPGGALAEDSVATAMGAVGDGQAPDDQERDAVTLAVVDLCQRWVAERTSGDGGSSLPT